METQSNRKQFQTTKCDFNTKNKILISYKLYNKSKRINTSTIPMTVHIKKKNKNIKMTTIHTQMKDKKVHKTV